MKFLLLITAVFFLATPGFARERKYITEDFFVETVKEVKKPDFLNAARRQSLEKENCREHIAKALCLVDGEKVGQDPHRRECQAGGIAYASHFTSVYDSAPAALQKMF